MCVCVFVLSEMGFLRTDTRLIRIITICTLLLLARLIPILNSFLFSFLNSSLCLSLFHHFSFTFLYFPLCFCFLNLSLFASIFTFPFMIVSHLLFLVMFPHLLSLSCLVSCFLDSESFQIPSYFFAFFSCLLFTSPCLSPFISSSLFLFACFFPSLLPSPFHKIILP